MKNLSLLIVFTILYGCALLNPYNSEFTCPQTEKGKCISVKGAYKESISPKQEIEISAEELQAIKRKETGCKEDSECPDDLFFAGQCNRCSMISDEDFIKKYKIVKQKEEKASKTSEDLYTEEKYNKMAKLLQEPVTPLMIPPKVIRVFLMPYEHDGELYTHRYLYIMVDDPKWVIGDYLIKKEIDY